MKKYTLIHGDCLDRLKNLPDNSVDSIVTDPPYGLSFMGKKWDYDVPSEDIWRECLRVLKPGGFLLAFAGTRTQHRMAVRIEDAGFEIRDMIAWVYGCLSDDTEILTKNGWERFDVSKLGSTFAIEEILIYDTETDTYKWELPSKWQHYNVKDTAYRIQSDSTDQVVSRNHRCLVERGGKLVFRKAEELQREESVPVLEGVPIMQQTISCMHKGAGSAKQVLWPQVHGQDDRQSKQRQKTKTTGVRYLRQSILPYLAKQKKAESILFNGVQWQIKGLAKDVCSKWEGQKESKKGDENGKKPCVERRVDLHEAQGQVCQSINQVCEMPAGVYSDVKKRRVCNGASVENSGADWKITDADGMCTSHKSRCNGQQDREFDAVQNQCRPQETRARASYNTTLATVEPIEYTGIIFCPTVSTGAFVARRNGKMFLTGNSGFPKSHNIGVAVDKLQGNEREVIGEIRAGKTAMGQNSGWNPHKNKTVMDATKGSSEWEGWGTALKPSLEPITVARKPLAENTVAANVLKYGVGGINIDGCRIPTEDVVTNHSRGSDSAKSKGKYGDSSSQESHQTNGQTLGRFPANLIHDGSDEVLAEFPDSKGQQGDLKGHSKDRKSKGIFGDMAAARNAIARNDIGSAARFFYTAKASKRDRNDGLSVGEQSTHPTVKPTTLMQYLCRLVTPPNGTVLDPFMGSGSTGKAAMYEGFDFIGIEREQEYVDISRARIEFAVNDNEPNEVIDNQLSLFPLR